MPSSESHNRRSPEQFEEIAEAAAMKAVRRTLLSLGIDPEDPVEAQQDFALLRRLRKAREKGAHAVQWAILIGLTTGIMTLVWKTITKVGS